MLPGTRLTGVEKVNGVRTLAKGGEGKSTVVGRLVPRIVPEIEPKWISTWRVKDGTNASVRRLTKFSEVKVGVKDCPMG